MKFLPGMEINFLPSISNLSYSFSKLLLRNQCQDPYTESPPPPVGGTQPGSRPQLRLVTFSTMKQLFDESTEWLNMGAFHCAPGLLDSVKRRTECCSLGSSQSAGVLAGGSTSLIRPIFWWPWCSSAKFSLCINDQKLEEVRPRKSAQIIPRNVSIQFLYPTGSSLCVYLESGRKLPPTHTPFLCSHRRAGPENYSDFSYLLINYILQINLVGRCQEERILRTEYT